MKKRAVLVEMGPRDGLQNEKMLVDVSSRIEFVRRLAETGLKRIEIGAFVHPKWIPQMAGSMEVVRGVLDQRKRGRIPAETKFAALVPNERGMQDALDSGIDEVAIFAATSESFSRKNINCSIDESFERFAPVMALARKHKVKVRGYLSTCFGCPFEGAVPEARVLKLARRMKNLGVYEVSIGDTIGVATPVAVESLFRKLKKVASASRWAGHFHDTRGQALANTLSAWRVGIHTFDSSAGGLGGCPYAPGATGNVSTEDVVYMFDGMGVKTGVELDKLVALNRWIEEKVGHPLPSRVGKAGLFKPRGFA